MKFLASQVSYFLDQRESRRNLRLLVKYLAFLISVIIAFTVAFHLIMLYVEGREFSWLSGLYWTLVVMSTLGFGDITFESDTGRAFSILVLLSGVVLLLIMLPFSFIRFFYAPWLEARLHARSPRIVLPETTDHVIICTYDTIAPPLIKKLERQHIPYFVIESDAAKAAEMFQDGISVVQGDIESVSTYRGMRVEHARLVVANVSDTANTNIILTSREVAPHVPVAAIAEDDDSIDILELSGASKVLPLKRLLGEKLAGRIGLGRDRVNIVGHLNEWSVIEFTVHGTDLSGKTLAEADLRHTTGINVIGVWDKVRLKHADSNTVLNDSTVVVGMGTKEQVERLNALIVSDHQPAAGPVLIIGGGKVGRAAGRALKERDRTVMMIELQEALRPVIGDIPDRLTIGNAADRHTLEKGGLNECSLVILSTNQDAVNIYLSIYCRRLNPGVKIVSRITHERNLEAMHRAGADFVLSYAPIGAESLMSLIQGRSSMILGEDIEFSNIELPPKLAGKTLQSSEIGEKTGLIVLAIEFGDETTVSPDPDHRLMAGSRLNVLGTTEQLATFRESFS